MINRTDYGGSPDEYYDRFGAGACKMAAIAAGSAAVPNSGGGGSWCIPASLDVSVENVEPMARAFLDYFEKKASRVANLDGRKVFLKAMRERWPCAKK
jgi:hypothetical protein